MVTPSFRRSAPLLLPLLLVACAGTGHMMDAGHGPDATVRDGGGDGSASMDAHVDLSVDAAADAPGADAGADAATDGAACGPGMLSCGGRCVNGVTDPMHCGSCANDCTALPGVDPTRVRCLSGCSLSGACTSGYGDCNAMTADGCESWLRSPMHCGNCTVACPTTAPLCTSLPTGAIACATACSAPSPDNCSGICTDVRTDGMNCGTCGHACPAGGAHTHGGCAASVCTTACDAGYHDCGGTCVSNADPATCGARCMPCPASSGGTATCGAGGVCGIACSATSTMCGTACVDLMTDRANCGGCMMPCAGACVMGACDTSTHVTVVSGDGQMGYPDQLLPTSIVVQVLDATGAPLPSVVVTFTVPPGAVVTPAMVTTDAMGRATFTLRLGRALGGYHVDVMAPMTTTPLGIDATAIAPPAGTIFPIHNVAHVPGMMGTPGPATVAGMGAARGLALDTDGTVYVSDATYHVIRAISPAGAARIVAGRSGMIGFVGDLGAATSASLNTPSGLALDPVAHMLYLADYGNNRVRVVNLTTGIISTVAGGGAAPAPTYGDGGSATAAALLQPGHVRLGPDGALYVGDVGHNMIRRIDVVTGLIGPYISGGLATCTGATVALSGCQAEPRSCDVVWDSGGRAFVSGYWCGSAIGTTTYAIVRRATDGTLTRVAGVAAGATTDGNPAASMLLNGVGSLASDAAGNVYYVETTGQRVRRIDGTQTVVATVIGTGVAGYGSDYTPAMGQPMNGPWDLAFDAGSDLYVSETGTAVVQTIWGAGSATAGSATFAIYGPATQTIDVDRATPMPIGARVTDGAGAPVIGLPVTFAPLDDGAGVVSTAPTTTAMGVAATFARPGLMTGDYRFRASFSDLHGVPLTGSPLTYTVTATAPAAGTIFTAVDTTRVAGAVENAGTLATTGQIGGLAAASDGTVYLADRTQHVVWRLSPHGQLTRYAGTAGALGFTGDLGPANLAHLSAPTGVALDELGHTLYVADLNNARIRAIDTTTGTIRTFAGGGAAIAPAYGDGAAATAALFATPANVAVDPAGTHVYVSDTGHGRIRVVDVATGIITAWQGTTTTCATAPVAFYGCNASQESCHVVFQSDGTAYVSGYICGTTAPLTATPAYGIVRVSTAGVVTHVAGMRLGATTDGLDAHMAGITGGGWLARTAAGAIYYVDFGLQKVRVIDATTGLVSSVAGTGVAGYAGDYTPASAAQVSTPWGLVLTAGHLMVADGGNNAVRVIW